MKIKKCALCHQERTLRLSHIIPEFLYRSMYDEKHRFHVVSVNPNERNQIKQKGISEQLLCDECENKFSQFERYASLVLNGHIELQIKKRGNLSIISGIDYHQFKLFQLSILWRAGVSRLNLFQRVKLGPHEERLRQLLLNNDPGRSSQYGCCMWELTLGPLGESASLIMQPTRVRIQGVITYKFTFGGLMWLYHVSLQIPPYPYNEIVLSNQGQLIIQTKGVEEMVDLSNFMNLVRAQDKLS